MSGGSNVTVDPRVATPNVSLVSGETWTHNVSILVPEFYDNEELQVSVNTIIDGNYMRHKIRIPITRTAVELTGAETVHGSMNSTVNADYILRNIGLTQPSVSGMWIASLPDGITVDGGDTRYFFGQSVPSPEENVSHEFQYNISSSASPGTYPVEIKGMLGDATVSMNTTLTVGSAIDRFDQYEPFGEIGRNDVLAAINAYYGNEQIGGQPVSRGDVLDVIQEYYKKDIQI